MGQKSLNPYIMWKVINALCNIIVKTVKINSMSPVSQIKTFKNTFTSLHVYVIGKKTKREKYDQPICC